MIELSYYKYVANCEPPISRYSKSLTANGVSFLARLPPIYHVLLQVSNTQRSFL